jgi:hypothetical protein
LFFVIEQERRKILHCNVTQPPTAEWIVQQLREAFPEACRYRYVILALPPVRRFLPATHKVTIAADSFNELGANSEERA